MDSGICAQLYHTLPYSEPQPLRLSLYVDKSAISAPHNTLCADPAEVP